MTDLSLDTKVALKDLMPLDEDDRILLGKLESSNTKGLKFLYTTDLEKQSAILSLIKIGLSDESYFNEIKKHKDFWDEVWRDHGERLFGKPYPTHSKIDSFTLLTGSFLYYKYTVLYNPNSDGSLTREQQIHKSSFLWHAANTCHYYDALDVLCWEMMHENINNLELSMDKIIEVALHATHYYQAPGLVLLKKIVHTIASRLEGKENTNTRLFLHALAYCALEKAEALMPVSKESIEICYDFEIPKNIGELINTVDEAKNTIHEQMISIQTHKKPKIGFYIDKKSIIQSQKELIKQYLNQARDCLWPEKSATPVPSMTVSDSNSNTKLL